MIPGLNLSGVLPPFLSNDSSNSPDIVAPYKVTLLEIAHRFVINEERNKILKGLISYRDALRAEGLSSGFQWIDGSFVENVEKNRGRPPKDVDIITFAFRPDGYNEQDAWNDFVNARLNLFDPEQSKLTYQCDAYFVDLQLNPIYLVNQTKYWFGLFSHQRETFQWKGMLEIPIDVDDSEVLTFLNAGGPYAS